MLETIGGLEGAAVPRAGADPQRSLRSQIGPYESSSVGKSIYQIATSIGLFLAACTAMYWSLRVSYFLTLALMLPTAGLLVRVFIVQHDCGHGAFFKKRRYNDLVGTLCSLMTFTPYAHWRRQHNGHHGNWNNLDKREPGADLYSTCLTVSEYWALSAWSRFKYRTMRHPILAYFLIPPFVFLFLYRVPFETPKTWTRERRSIYLTNAALVVMLVILCLTLGFRQVLLVQLPIVSLTAMVGVGLFSVQHRFDGTVWSRQGDWNPVNAALEGSSYFKLPRILQWFTGNIGFHHIHHLSPRVPNYRLEACHNAIPALQRVARVGLWDGMKSIRLILWDETAQRMVRFRDARKGRNVDAAAV